MTDGQAYAFAGKNEPEHMATTAGTTMVVTGDGRKRRPKPFRKRHA